MLNTEIPLNKVHSTARELASAKYSLVPDAPNPIKYTGPLFLELSCPEVRQFATSQIPQIHAADTDAKAVVAPPLSKANVIHAARPGQILAVKSSNNNTL